MNYRYDLTNSLCKHDLSKVKMNKKLEFLIDFGYTFWYPPQNCQFSELDFMRDPITKVGEHYEVIYDRLQKNLKYPTLF